MQNILIPTDFKAGALDCIPSLCRQFKGEELGLVMVHMFRLSDSISDLLMLSKRSREYEQISDEFYEAVRQLKSHHPQIKFVKIEFLYGSTLSLFRNFLEANSINYILDTSDCSIDKIHVSSIDPTVLIQKCRLPVIKINRVTAQVSEPEVAEAEMQLAEF